jgi:hypothetical protein
VTDFSPWIKALGVESWLKSVIGVEISTLDIGHYIGFPIDYVETKVPDHGAVDWYCMSSNQVIDDVVYKRSGFTGTDPTTIIAHPRDGFLGWAYQMGLDNFSMTRYRDNKLDQDTQVFRTVTCDHDAMEVFNAKRFDLIHTPTVREIHTFERCVERITRAGIDPVTGQLDKAKMKADLDHSCPEMASRGLERLTTCPETMRPSECKLLHRAVLSRLVNADSLVRTKKEQDLWYSLETSWEPKKAYQISKNLAKWCAFDKDCPADKLFTANNEYDDCISKRLSMPVEDAVPGLKAHIDGPCVGHPGVMQDYFRMLEWGMVKAVVGGSDSHSSSLEPGLPRTYIRSSVDKPGLIEPDEIARNLRKGQVVPTYGPFVTLSVNGVGPGEIAIAERGQKLQLQLKVQTPSWFGIDRIEVYLNGRLAYSEGVNREPSPADLAQLATSTGTSAKPAWLDHKRLDTKPSDIVDYDKIIELQLPSHTERPADSWVVVAVMGLHESNWLSPVYLDVPFGELQLPLVASMAFANVPALSFMFPRPVMKPDIYPVRPYAMTNAVLIDSDQNGTYDAPHFRQPFCSPACDAKTGQLSDGSGLVCSDIQNDYVCLEPEKRCGVPISGVCDIYKALQTTKSHGKVGN